MSWSTDTLNWVFQYQTLTKPEIDMFLFRTIAVQIIDGSGGINLITWPSMMRHGYYESSMWRKSRLVTMNNNDAMGAKLGRSWSLVWQIEYLDRKSVV